MIPKSTYKSFFNAIYSVILSKEKSNKTSVEKLASSFGITDKNTIKEITETAIVTIARKIANQQNKSVKQKYDEIVDLYKSQVNLSHRTSQSMLLQQYSTPATIGFLMGMYCKVNQPGNYYEPSAGNGMLTIANSGKDFTVNEIDTIRFQNLEFQDIYKLITRTDSSQETYKSKYFDAIITNPPFATVNKDEYLILGEYEIKHLDHKMAILALNSMKDTGKAAIIVGSHTSWDDKGRIQAGKNRIFLSYLYKNYNVEDIILIDGNALYSKMGTGFDTRIILINGRKAKPEGFAPLKNDVLSQVIKTTDELYSRFSKNFENKGNQKLSSEDFRTQMNKIIDSKLKDISTSKGKALRLRAKAVSIKQKQLLQIGQLGATSQKAILKAIDEVNHARSVKYWMEPEFNAETYKYAQKAKANSFIKTTNSISDDVVAYDEKGNIVGSISISNQGSEKGAFKIVVREDALRKGWGKKLLDKAATHKIDIIGNIKYNSFSASGRELVRSWLKSKLKQKK